MRHYNCHYICHYTCNTHVIAFVMSFVIAVVVYFLLPVIALTFCHYNRVDICVDIGNDLCNPSVMAVFI